MAEIDREVIIKMLENVSSRVTIVLNENMNSDQITVIAGRSAYRELTNFGLTLHQSVEKKGDAK